MTEIADIFRVHGRDYLTRHGDYTLPSHKRAIWDIMACRSGGLGGHLMACETCGHIQHSYHSCCNRSCPKCLTNRSEKWVEEKTRSLLPATYFHVVFTIPKELRWIVLRHQKVFYSILFKAAAKTLKKLGKDPHYIGGDIGFYAVLHTWTRALLFHPHIHCLIPGGGIDAKGQWTSGRNNYLFPVKPMADMFRAIFMKLARKALPDMSLPAIVWKPKWVVHIKASIQGPDKVIKYLGRYIHRIAITNNRIISLNEGKVSFKYRDHRDSRWKVMTLPALQFIHRFLQHVLPKGFHKVRAYGCLHPTQKGRLKQAMGSDVSESSCDTKEVTQPRHQSLTLPCRKCAGGTMRVIDIIMPWFRFERQVPRGPP